MTERTSTSAWKGSQADSREQLLSDSLLRISLAAVGGALVGLSFRHSRRRLYPFSSSSTIQTSSYLPYENAPYTFAIRFTAFVGILEFHRLLSPTQIILSWYYHPRSDVSSSTVHNIPAVTHDSSVDRELQNQQHDDKGSTSHTSSWMNLSKASIMILDYTIGGFVAGGIFSRFPNIATHQSASPPQSSNTSKKLKDHETIKLKQKKLIGKGRLLVLPSPKPTLITPISIPTSTPTSVSTEGYTPPLKVKHAFHFRQAILRGALPGLALGFLAGLLQYSLDELLLSIQEIEEERQTLDLSHAQSIEDEDIHADVKSMTTDELKREIQILRNRKS